MKSTWMWVVCALVWTLSAAAEHESGTVRPQGEGENGALKALGIKETRVAFTPHEAPLTYEEALAKCHGWGMQLPRLQDLVALKPHLHGLLSGLSHREEGFVWAEDPMNDHKFPRVGFSLETRAPIMPKRSGKGVALCVTYADGPRGQFRWMDLLAKEMERAYSERIKSEDKLSAYASTLKRFEQSFPLLSSVARTAVNQVFLERRRQDAEFLALEKERDDDEADDRRRRRRRRAARARAGVF